MLKTSYKADFICDGKLILELKASSGLTGDDVAQIINDMKAAGIEHALLINFGKPKLQYQYLVKKGFAKEGKKVEESVD